MAQLAIIVHGGAGDISDAEAKPHRRGVAIAAQIGWSVLRAGGSALDAAQAAIISMEDDPAFDAGYGSFLNRDGVVEMDASMMDGRTLDAGAVAGVQRVKNVIVLARRVMESEYTLFVARGAEEFAVAHGIALVENETLRSPAQIEIWKECQRNSSARDTTQDVAPRNGGTVGCVAVDRAGNIAAGTCTGGMKFKPAGRVGDSPIVGAGTYADNLLGGASATGWGEAITRVVLAKFAVDALAGNREPNVVAKTAIEYLAQRVGGTGGIILADREGRVGLAYNTSRMARAWITESSPQIIAEC
ncbi:MAG: isoaspartyl peptidase/L-asparaginase [Chloroflexi bacterium]|nr:isoaspartyl peptidase/L-asparaginase [Chloroflexota bacterium]